MREETKDRKIGELGLCGRLRSPFQLGFSFLTVWEVKISCGNPKSQKMVTAATKLKDAYSLEEKL